MPAKPSPLEISISKDHARRFQLTHQGLFPPRKLDGKQGVLDFIRRVNCIQYDPINVVGQNPHLVLQSRVHNYKPAMLNALLYEDRKLLDGFDKQMSIFPVEDWPSFAMYRKNFGAEYAGHQTTVQAAKLMAWAKKEIKERGPLSSIDLEEDTRIDWWLSGTTRAVRIALDILFISGEIVVHHRVGTRRYFDLAKRVIPAKLFKGKKPRVSEEAYKDWHVYRRCGGVGLVQTKNDAKWGGIHGWQAAKIRASINRLADAGKLVHVKIDGLPREKFFVRGVDLPLLDITAKPSRARKGAAFIAPLDNMTWQRGVLSMLFDFDYIWEVYIPTPKRKWGYYVLPVLYGDRFVARLDPAFDRATKTFVILNWWWQPGVDKKDGEMLAALQDCVRDFARYLGASDVKLGDTIKNDRTLKKIVS
jgi:uncharacterized protein YcaQ